MSIIIHVIVQRRRRFQQSALMQYTLWAGIGGTVLLFFLFLMLFVFLSRNLPSPGKLARSDGYSTVFYDRDGKVLFEMYKDQNRIPVKITQVPKILQEATIAVEDKNFYSHQGFSLSGIFRAAFKTLTGDRLEGGSTLTQQLVKKALLTDERTLTRKIKEFVLAVEIERRYSKDQILEFYLNEIPYGGSYWGVQSAARGYFNKDVSDLNLVESAILAGLPQSPSRYSPYIGEKDAYKGRTKTVLRRMREEKYITRDQEQKALAQLDKVVFTEPKLAITAPHFVFYVRQQLVKQFGEAILDQGLKIQTTLSFDAQRAAEKIVKEEVDKLKAFKATNGALVVLDSKSGEVLALVGSADYNAPKFGRFDVATKGLRQPGSSIKPITYATAFEKGYTPATVLMDVQTTFANQGDKEYIPVNYDGKYHGPVQLRFALGNSFNIPAVKLLAMVGIKPFLQKAYDMGITTFQPTRENLNRFGLSLTLGGGEVTLLDLTSAYSVFARGGETMPITSIREVKNYKGKKILKAPAPVKRRVLSQDVAFLISHILSDNNARSIAFGPSSYLNIPGKTVAVKTGTTNSKRDNWTFGYTTDVTVGVWVGNNDNTPMNEKIASGVTGASPIWNRMMREMLKKYHDGIIAKPDGVNALQIDSLLGGLPKDGIPTRSEYFIKGTEPTEVSPFFRKLKVSKSDETKLANDIEIKQGNYVEKDYIVISEIDPVSTDGKNRWQEGIDAWAAGQADPRYKYPHDSSSVNQDDVIVAIKSPTDHGQSDGSEIQVTARIIALTDLDLVEIYIDGNKVKTYNENKKELDDKFSVGSGQHSVTVKARNTKGKIGESTITFGMNEPWKEPTPTPTSILP